MQLERWWNVVANIMHVIIRLPRLGTCEDDEYDCMITITVNVTAKMLNVVVKTTDAIAIIMNEAIVKIKNAVKCKNSVRLN